MSRPAVTPAKRVAKTVADLALLDNAVKAAARALTQGDADGLAEAAKFIEAVGCYARRTAAVLPVNPVAPAAIPTVESQKVAVFGPNLRDQSKGQFVVHAKGCGDIAKAARQDPEFRNPYVFTATSMTEIADNTYADHIDGGEMEPGEGLSDHHFCPCVKLPVA